MKILDILKKIQEFLKENSWFLYFIVILLVVHLLFLQDKSTKTDIEIKELKQESAKLEERNKEIEKRIQELISENEQMDKDITEKKDEIENINERVLALQVALARIRANSYNY